MDNQWNSEVIANPNVKSYEIHRIVVVDALPDERDEDTLYLVQEA